jgi:hypothetical protein
MKLYKRSAGRDKAPINVVAFAVGIQAVSRKWRAIRGAVSCVTGERARRGHRP